MNQRRTLILVGAIVIGVVAALLLFNYVKGIEDRANNNAARVDVFVAKGEVPRGTPGEEAVKSGAVGSSKIQQEFKPATSINSPDELMKKVALFDIAPGTVIVQGMFVDPAQTQISFRQRIKNPEHVAITVSVDQIRGVGGFLVPGDVVNIMVFPQQQAVGDAEGAAASTQGLLGAPARFLYQKVQILAVGANALLAPGEATGETAGAATDTTGVITFNVPPEAALWIATAQNSGGLYVTLVGDDYKPVEIPPTYADGETLPGEDPARLTPYGPEGNKE